MVREDITQDLLAETTPRCVAQRRDAPAELDQAEAEASDDRSLADRCSHDTAQSSRGQATPADSAQTYSEEAHQALIQVYDLLLNLARHDDADDEGPLSADVGSGNPPDTLEPDGNTEAQEVERGLKEAVHG